MPSKWSVSWQIQTAVQSSQVSVKRLPYLSNAAFESDDYKEENLDVYTKVKYQDHKNIIKSINLLIDKKYSTRDISIILAHGNDSDVLEFAKKDKIKYLEEFYSYDYAKIKNYDRYIAHMDLNGDDEETTIIKVNMNIDKEDYTDAVLIDDYNKTVIANKHFYCLYHPSRKT